jgi:hypothetical protein
MLGGATPPGRLRRARDTGGIAGIRPGRRHDERLPARPGGCDDRIVTTPAADVQNGRSLVRLEVREGADGIDRFSALAETCCAQAPECPFGQLAIVFDPIVQSAAAIHQLSFEADQVQISAFAPRARTPANDNAYRVIASASLTASTRPSGSAPLDSVSPGLHPHFNAAGDPGVGQVEEHSKRRHREKHL